MSAGAFTFFAEALLITVFPSLLILCFDTRIDEAVDQVYDQIDHCEAECKDDDAAHDRRDVTALDGLDHVTADSRPCEHALGQYGTA